MACTSNQQKLSRASLAGTREDHCPWPSGWLWGRFLRAQAPGRCYDRWHISVLQKLFVQQVSWPRKLVAARNPPLISFDHMYAYSIIITLSPLASPRNSGPPKARGSGPRFIWQVTCPRNTHEYVDGEQHLDTPFGGLEDGELFWKTLSFCLCWMGLFSCFQVYRRKRDEFPMFHLRTTVFLTPKSAVSR